MFGRAPDRVVEAQLFEEKEIAQTTLESIAEGVITTDAENNVEYINPVAEELTGWKVDDANGRPIDMVDGEAFCADAIDAMRARVARGAVGSAAALNASFAGSWRSWARSASPRFNWTSRASGSSRAASS